MTVPFLVWFIVYQIYRPVMGIPGELISVVIPHGYWRMEWAEQNRTEFILASGEKLWLHFREIAEGNFIFFFSRELIYCFHSKFIFSLASLVALALGVLLSLHLQRRSEKVVKKWQMEEIRKGANPWINHNVVINVIPPCEWINGLLFKSQSVRHPALVCRFFFLPKRISTRLAGFLQPRKQSIKNIWSINPIQQRGPQYQFFSECRSQRDSSSFWTAAGWAGAADGAGFLSLLKKPCSFSRV